MNPTDKNGMPADEQEPEALFANVNFSVVPGKSLKEDQIREVSSWGKAMDAFLSLILSSSPRVSKAMVAHTCPFFQTRAE